MTNKTNSKQQTIETLKALKVKANSIIVNKKFVVVRTRRNYWHLGELMGDWLMGGTVEEVVDRIYR